MEAREQLHEARRICHEMNQPIQVLSWHVEMLLKKSNGENSQREMLNSMKSELRRLRDTAKALTRVLGDVQRDPLEMVGDLRSDSR